MLKVQNNFHNLQISQIPAHQSQSPGRISIYQNGDNCITALFSRAIQWMKDLIQRVCSCGKKPLAITAPPVSANHVVANMQPPANNVLAHVQPPAPEIAANLVPANVQAPPPPDGRAFVDLENIVQRPLRGHEPSQYTRMTLGEVNLNIAMHDPSLAQARANIEHQNGLPHDQRDDFVIAIARHRLETADAKLAAMRQRRAELYAAVLPQEYWNRIDRMSTEAEVQAEIAAVGLQNMDLFNRYYRVEGEARRLVALDLDRGYAKLRELKDRHHPFAHNALPAILAEVPQDENNIPNQQPDEVIQRRLAQDLADIAKLHYRGLTSEIVFLQRQLSQSNGIADRLIIPRQLNEVRYVRATAEARLAALQARRTQLLAIVLPEAFWNRLDHMDFEAVRREIHATQDRVEHLTLRENREQGEDRRLVRQAIDIALACERVLFNCLVDIGMAGQLLEAQNRH